MNTWTMNETEGFLQAELDEINAAKAVIFDEFVTEETEYFNVEQNLDDALNNAWSQTCRTASDLIKAIRG